MVTAYKAFNEDWTCRDQKYEVGKTYTHDGPVEMCGSGFHACLSPFDCWAYYDLTTSKFAVVEIDPAEEHESDSKVVSASIHIKAELTLPEFIKAGVQYLIDLTKGKDEGGDRAQISSSGDGAKIGSSGYGAQIGSSGDEARIGSSGDGAKIGSSGDRAKIDSEGKESVIASAGIDTKAKGKKGTWISLAEFDDSGKCVGFATGCVGQKGIKENTWYHAKCGKLVAC